MITLSSLALLKKTWDCLIDARITLIQLHIKNGDHQEFSWWSFLLRNYEEVNRLGKQVIFDVVDPTGNGKGRFCTKCGELKPLSEFASAPNRIGGVHSQCYECMFGKKKKEFKLCVGGAWVDYRKCNVCGEEKPATAFNPSTKFKCKRCTNWSPKNRIVKVKIDGKTVECKRCAMCQEIRPLSLFKKGGKYSYCKYCVRIEKRQEYKKNPQKQREYMIRYYEKYPEKAKEHTRNYNILRDLWSKSIKELDGNKCIVCNSTENLEAHHLFSVSVFPELELTPENGITLCVWCHRLSDNKESFHQMYGYGNNTPKQTVEWLEKLKISDDIVGRVRERIQHVYNHVNNMLCKMESAM